MSNIDWTKLASHSLWLLGLAVLLVAVGFCDYRRREARLPLKGSSSSL